MGNVYNAGLAGFLVFAGIISFVNSAPGGVMLGGAQSTMRVSANPATNQIPSANPSALPYLNTLTHTYDAGTGRTSNNSSTFDLTTTKLVTELSHFVTNGGWSRTESDLYFIPDEPVDYRIFAYSNASAGAGDHNMQIRLMRITGINNEILFRNEQRTMTHFSGNTNDETFVAGGTAGNTSNVLVGSLTGRLNAGSLYFFEVIGTTDSYSGWSSNRAGDVMITFTPVPEPAAGFLLIAAIATGMRRRR